MRKKRVLRGAVAAVVTLGLLGGLLVGTVLLGHDYRFTQRAVAIPGPAGDLDGVLTLPVDGAARGLVVMVHGDGPVDATRDGLYAPWFEGAADAGLATLSWSKPGVGGSDGDWLAQSMSDRAAEVSAALDWARARDDVPTDVVVLWGASQAGWVVPAVVRDRDGIDAVVAVGTAINWLRQGRHHLLAELEHADADTQERQEAVARSDRLRELIGRGAPYAEYLAAGLDDEPMSAARWGFVLRNVGADATADLAAAAQRDVPVHLMVGAVDRHVDVAETEAAYREAFGERLTVTRVEGAAHSLARTVMEDRPAVGVATAVVWPRALFPAEVIDDYTAFLATVGR